MREQLKEKKKEMKKAKAWEIIKQLSIEWCKITLTKSKMMKNMKRNLSKLNSLTEKMETKDIKMTMMKMMMIKKKTMKPSL